MITKFRTYLGHDDRLTRLKFALIFAAPIWGMLSLPGLLTGWTLETTSFSLFGFLFVPFFFVITSKSWQAKESARAAEFRAKAAAKNAAFDVRKAARRKTTS